MEKEITTKEPSTGQKIVALYNEGASDVEVARLLGLSSRKFNELEQENEQFADLLERGRTLAQAWWYEQHRKNLTNKEFQTSLYISAMKNRFGWADKVDMGDKNDTNPVNSDQLAAQLRAQIKKIEKKNPDFIRNLVGGSSDG